MKKLLLLLAVTVKITLLSGQEGGETFPLYAGEIPNFKASEPLEQVETRPNGQRFISYTTQPTYTLFKPKRPNGMAVVICPGGGYRGTSIDKEGYLVAKELNSVGITAVVVKYRIPDDRSNVDKSLAPLQDAQQAIRLVRQNAAKWKVNPDQVGIMGFSAGGHLASTAATHYKTPADPDVKDKTNLRPDFVVLIYPVISFTDSLAHMGSRENLLGPSPSEDQIKLYSNELQVTSDSPPAFLVHAGDDKTVKVENSIAYYLACLHHGVDAEMHIYPKGGHGFGMLNTTTGDKWMNRLKIWLDGLKPK